MAGEPLLHPSLELMLEAVKELGIVTGLSTNGLLIKERLEAVTKVDVLTISVDSLDPEEYSRLRPPAELDELIDNIDFIVNQPAGRRPKQIHLQIVSPLSESKDSVERRLQKMSRRWPQGHVIVRSVLDCFVATQGRGELRGEEPCMNPWSSVSVQSDGTVVSCCYAFSKEYEANIYGNLKERPLREIWYGEAAQRLRARMARGDLDGALCSKCYLRSPVLLHLDFLARYIQANGRRST